MRRLIVSCVGVGLLVLLCASSAWADSSADGSEVTTGDQVVKSDKMPATSVIYKNLTVIRLNPLGLQNRFGLFWRKRLSDSDSLLRKNTYMMAGATAMVTPSLQRFGARVEVQPLAILQLFAGADLTWFLGNFDYMTSYKSADANYSDTDLKAASEAGQNYGAMGLRLTFGGILQGKVGPIAIRSNTRVHYYRMDTRDDDPLWFDIFDDILSPSRGFTFVQNNDVLFVRGRLVAGIRHTWSRSLLGDLADTPAVKALDTPRDSTHRVGPFIAYRLNDQDPYVTSMFRRPTLVVLTQWWVQHPYRTGQDVSQAFPWTVVAFAFGGQFSASN